MNIPHPCLLCNTLTLRQKTGRHGDGGTGSVVVEDGARVIFLVSKLLQFPVEQCSHFLRRYGHPVEWVVLCANCDLIVDQGTELFVKMEKIRVEFDQVKGMVQNMISLVKPEVKGDYDYEVGVGFGERGGEKIGDIAKQIRSFVVKERKSVRKENCTIKGPSSSKGRETRSKQKLEVIEDCTLNKDDFQSGLDFDDICLGEEILLDPAVDDEDDDNDPIPTEYDSDYDPSTEDNGTNPSKRRSVTKDDSTPDDKRNRENATLGRPPQDFSTLSIPSTPSWTWLNFLSWRKSLVSKKANLIPPLSFLISHFSITSFPCPFCDTILPTLPSWKKHKSNCTKLGHSCPHCPIKYTRIRRVEEHVRKIHTSPQDLACSGCLDIFVPLSEYVSHVESNPVCRTFSLTCQPCKDRGTPSNHFQTQVALDVHTQVKHPPMEKMPYKCPHCDHRFMDKIMRTRHVERNHAPAGNVTRTICHICGKSVKYLRTHVNAVHLSKGPGARRYNCEVCGKGMTSTAKLKRHRQIHMREEDAPHVCALCGKRFKVLDYLRNHMKGHDDPRGRRKRVGGGIKGRLMVESGDDDY